VGVGVGVGALEGRWGGEVGINAHFGEGRMLHPRHRNEAWLDRSCGFVCMQAILVGYRLGVDIHTLAAWYGTPPPRNDG
jgi:hypothetical protein